MLQHSSAGSSLNFCDSFKILHSAFKTSIAPRLTYFGHLFALTGFLLIYLRSTNKDPDLLVTSFPIGQSAETSAIFAYHKRDLCMDLRIDFEFESSLVAQRFYQNSHET